MDLDVSHINEDSIRQSNREWFPYDFTMDGYFNIIDQDGSLRIYTDKSEKDGSIDDSIENIIKYVY